MQIVIDIPEEMYAQIINEDGIDTMLIPYKDIIKNGKPLPKGHGDLKDADKLTQSILCQTFGLRSVDIDNAPTIVEADKENTNE